jgi:tetratricopeptide (TPR) repeat protein
MPWPGLNPLINLYRKDFPIAGKGVIGHEVQPAQGNAVADDSLEQVSRRAQTTAPFYLNFTGWIFRPFIDLHPQAPSGNEFTAGLIFAIDTLMTGERHPRIQGVMSDGMRRWICRKAVLPQYDVEMPQYLPKEWRTPEWDYLCTCLNNMDLLETDRQTDVLWLLYKLGMHEAVIEYADDARNTEQLAIKGLSRFAIDGSLSTLKTVYKNSLAGSWEGLESTYTLAAASAKFHNNLPDVEKYVESHAWHIRSASRPSSDSAMLRSRLRRVKAFIPMMRKDWQGMREEMDAAQQYASVITTRDFAEKAQADVVRSALWESRAKEARIYGDFLLEIEYAKKYVQVAPLSALSHFALADAYNNAEEYGKAMAEFQLTARYGPPKDAEALFMAMQFMSPGSAAHLFLDCANLELLTLGEISDSSREAIRKAAYRSTDGPLHDWTHA